MAKKDRTALAVILTDTHQDESNIDVINSIFKQARKLAKSLGLTRIYHGGDIFDSRKAQPQGQLTSFLKILDQFKEDDMVLSVIPGNHDKTDYKLANSFLDPYRDHPHFDLTRLSSGHSLDNNTYLIMIPFFADEQYIKEVEDAIVMLPKDKKKVLLTHIGVNDAKMNNGTRVTSSVNASLFALFDLVLIGHYHDPQEMCDGKIKYIGASLQHNFGESYVKGATVLYDDLTIETIPLEFPKYLKYEIDAKDLTQKDIKDLKSEVDGSNDHIRVVLVGKEADVKAFDKQALLNVGVDVKTKEEAIVKEDLESRVEAFDSTSLLDEFGSFCKKNDLSKKEGLVYLQKVL